MAEASEPKRMPSRVCIIYSLPVPSKARPAINKLMVNPMPHSTDTPNIAPKLTPSGSRANRSRTASQDARNTPIGLPVSRPGRDAEWHRLQKCGNSDASERHAGVGKCKQRQDRERNRRVKVVLQAPQGRMRFGAACAKRNEQRQRDAGQRDQVVCIDRGVDCRRDYHAAGRGEHR